MSFPSSCALFDPELESIQEFFQRFQCQMAEPLHKVRNYDLKRANILVQLFLPVNIVSKLQRRLSPTLLGDATYDEISNHLHQQFSTSKSTVGASVQFLTYKQQSGQSIEDYSRKLNSLASQCNCLLRDAFVAGLLSPSILETLIQECDQLTFRQTLERAKLLETFRKDVGKISSSRHHRVHAHVLMLRSKRLTRCLLLRRKFLNLHICATDVALKANIFLMTVSLKTGFATDVKRRVT